MPLKKVKPDPRFSGTKASVATARGTSVKSKQQVNAQRAPSEWDKRIEANKAKLAATPDFKADTIASNELIGNQNTYTADTPANKFWKTKLGTAISGIWAGLGFQAPPAGRELGSMPSEYVAGTVLGAGAQIASFGTMINPLKATAVTTLDK
ncbi:MAG: hypothetical protein KAS32_28865, partial [Candidatus Peribacteraceae bacterium]|nr:hypothetical protein [Candidatus Peribacteraceae bacterium]